VLKKPKDKKKPSRKNLVKKADTAFASYIRSLSPQCTFCARPTEHCFHIISRSYYSVRWDEENAVPSCAGCNMEMNYHPHKFIEFLIKQRGPEFYLTLCEKSKKQQKLYADDLIGIAQRFTDKLANKAQI